MGECPSCHLIGMLCVGCGLCWPCHPDVEKRVMEFEALITGIDPFTGKRMPDDGG